MIYAVNTNTKEHRKIDAPWEFNEDEYPVAADNEGWVKWSGSKECPLPTGANHQVLMRDGAILPDDDPESWMWHHGMDEDDIVAYRPIFSNESDESVTNTTDRGAWSSVLNIDFSIDEEGTDPDWAGYDATELPPVGTICKARNVGVWYEAEILAHYTPTVGGPPVAVYAYKVVGGRNVGQLIRGNFREIESEKDRAIREMVEIMEKYVTEEESARALYEAGYIK